MDENDLIDIVALPSKNYQCENHTDQHRSPYLAAHGCALARRLHGGSAYSYPTPAKTPTSIQLNWSYDFGFAGFYAAEKKGRFAAQNLDVKLVAGGFQDGKFIDPIQSVLDGHADFGMASAIDLLTARAAGRPLVAVAAVLQRSPLVLISVAKNNIRRPQDLVGHKVAVNTGGVTLAYNTLLSSQGIDPKSITTLDRTNSGVDDLTKG